MSNPVRIVPTGKTLEGISLECDLQWVKLVPSAPPLNFPNMRKRALSVAPIGSIWQHFKKGDVYEVTGFGLDTERESLNVHYKRIGGPSYDPVTDSIMSFDRPIDQWLDLVGEKRKSRFTCLRR